MISDATGFRPLPHRGTPGSFLRLPQDRQPADPSPARDEGEPDEDRVEKVLPGEESSEVENRRADARAREGAEGDASDAKPNSGPREKDDAEPRDDRLLQVRLRAIQMRRDPERTIAALETARRSAMTPVKPSAEDYRVAAEATREIAETRRLLDAERRAEQEADVEEALGGRDPRAERNRSEYRRTDDAATPPHLDLVS